MIWSIILKPGFVQQQALTVGEPLEASTASDWWGVEHRSLLPGGEIIQLGTNGSRIGQQLSIWRETGGVSVVWALEIVLGIPLAVVDLPVFVVLDEDVAARVVVNEPGAPKKAVFLFRRGVDRFCKRDHFLESREIPDLASSIRTSSDQISTIG